MPSRAMFRAAAKTQSFPMVFEIARSEIGYTFQRPGEYATAVTAAARGLKVLVVEKQAQFGGTTARSGGWLWIPGTKLALEQGGYDWGMLAYAVGFGGSMIWFGSSAGVAITNKFPEGRSVARWLKSGWWIAAAYVIGFFILLALRGWEPVLNYK